MMKPARMYLAIDAGGSKGRAATLYRGRISARSVPGNHNYRDTAITLFESRITSLVSPLLEGLTPRPGSICACAAIAGAGGPGLLERCEKIVKRALRPFAGRVCLKVMTDIDAMVEVCIGTDDGIVLIAGTGSICKGVKWQGGRRRTERVGGVGSYMDPGSGCNLGRAVLIAAREASYGKRREDLLLKLLCETHEIDPWEIRMWLRSVRGEVARAARVALKAYALGDPFSRSLVRASVRDLVGMVLEVREKLNLGTEPMIYVCGGLFRSPIIRRLFAGGIRRRLPRANITVVENPLLRILRLAMSP